MEQFPSSGRQDAAHDLHSGGFPAPGADIAHQLSFLNGEADVFESFHCALFPVK